MNCPACGKRLSERTVDGIAIDVCRSGCAGLWFDAGELRHFDEQDEVGGERLERYSRAGRRRPRPGRRLHCPRCPDTLMARRHWSVRYEVEIDECPTCGGIWLDAGELAAIRALFATEEERRAAARTLAESLLDRQPRKPRLRLDTGALGRAMRVVERLPFIATDRTPPPG